MKKNLNLNLNVVAFCLQMATQSQHISVNRFD